MSPRRTIQACGVATLAAGALACSPPPAPGLGEIMTLTQMRHAKLWYAGEAHNWALVDYELDELQEGFADVVAFHPTHKDAPLPMSTLIPKMTTEPLKELREAVASHDAKAFASAYDDLTRACNSCHQATNFGFNVVKRPSDAAWFSNQDFSPPRE